MWSAWKCITSSSDRAHRRERERAVTHAVAQIRANTVSVSVGGCGFSDADAIRVFEALQGNSSVQSLELFGNRLRESAMGVLAEALRNENCFVRTIDLDNNNLSDAGVESLSDALLTNSKVTVLSAHSNQIGPLGGASLASVLEANNTLTTMSLQENLIGDAGALQFADALAKSRMLRTLSLAGNGISCDGAEAIAKGLASNQSLRQLSLAQNRVGNSGARAFSLLLQGKSMLRELHLEDNNICDEGALDLARAIRLNQQLQELSLHKNPIGSAGVNAFANALCHNNSLQRLGLSVDMDEIKDVIGDMDVMRRHHAVRRAITSIASGNPTVSLVEFNLNDVDVHRIVAAMEQSSALRELRLESCSLDNKAAARLAATLKRKSGCSLETLYLANNKISKSGAKRLSDAFNQNTKLSLIDLTNNPAVKEGLAATLQRRHGCGSDAGKHCVSGRHVKHERTPGGALERKGRKQNYEAYYSDESDGGSSTTLDLDGPIQSDPFSIDEDSSSSETPEPSTEAKIKGIDRTAVASVAGAVGESDDDGIPSAGRRLSLEVCGSPMRADRDLVELLSPKSKSVQVPSSACMQPSDAVESRRKATTNLVVLDTLSPLSDVPPEDMPCSTTSFTTNHSFDKTKVECSPVVRSATSPLSLTSVFANLHLGNMTSPDHNQDDEEMLRDPQLDDDYHQAPVYSLDSLCDGIPVSPSMSL